MQPRLVQVPPKRPRSRMATFQSSNRWSRIVLPDPVPMMTRSKWFGRGSVGMPFGSYRGPPRSHLDAGGRTRTRYSFLSDEQTGGPMRIAYTAEQEALRDEL